MLKNMIPLVLDTYPPHPLETVKRQKTGTGEAMSKKETIK